MGKRSPRQGDVQLGQMAEVGGAQLAWSVLLRKEDLLGRSCQRPPRLELALQGAQLSILEAARKLALQIAKQRLGLQPWVDRQHRLQLLPNAGKRIFPRAPGVGAPTRAGKGAGLAILAGRL